MKKSEDFIKTLMTLRLRVSFIFAYHYVKQQFSAEDFSKLHFITSRLFVDPSRDLDKIKSTPAIVGATIFFFGILQKHWQE